MRQCAIRGLLAIQPLDLFCCEAQRLEKEWKHEKKVQRKLTIIQILEGIMELAAEGKDENVLNVCRPLCFQLIEYLPKEKQSLVMHTSSNNH